MLEIVNNTTNDASHAQQTRSSDSVDAIELPLYSPDSVGIELPPSIAVSIFRVIMYGTLHNILPLSGPNFNEAHPCVSHTLPRLGPRGGSFVPERCEHSGWPVAWASVVFVPENATPPTRHKN